MIRNRVRCAVVATVALLVPLAAVVSPTGAGAVTTSSITISGTLTGVAVPSRVIVLTLAGQSWSSSAITGGKFSIEVPSSDRAVLKNATLQVLTAAGGYVGPVVLAKAPEDGNPACKKSTKGCPTDDFLGLHAIKGSKVAVGSLRGESVAAGEPSWFLSKGAKSAILGTYIVRAKDKAGEPYGAATDGFVKSGIPDAAVISKSAALRAHDVEESGGAVLPAWIPFPGESSVGALDSAEDAGASPSTGDYSEACPSTTDPAIANAAAVSSDGVATSTPAGTAPGQGLDCSGVPNAVNLDVNGNGTLNTVDTSSSSVAATSITTWAQLQAPANSAISWHTNNSLNPTSIDSWLSGLTQQSFGVTAVVPQSALFPSDGTGSDVTASVDCGTLTWCSTADVGYAGSAPAVWSSLSTPYELKAYPTNCPNPANCSSSILGAGILPSSGTDIISAITPGQVLTVNGTQLSGGTASTELQVAPYFVTTPYLTGSAAYTAAPGSPEPLMTSDSSGSNPGATGTLHLSLFRPERPTVAGETSTSGLMDQSGLNYQVKLSQAVVGNQPGGSAGICPASSISNVTGGTVVSESTGGQVDDATTTDFDPAQSGTPGPIGFSVDLSSCAAALGTGYRFTAGDTYDVEVIANGVATSTGGAPTTWISFQVQVP